MANCLKRHAEQYIEDLEDDPSDVTTYLIPELLYPRSKTLQFPRTLAIIKSLEAHPMEWWEQLAKRWLLDAPCVEVKMVPSAELCGENDANAAKRREFLAALARDKSKTPKEAEAEALLAAQTRTDGEAGSEREEKVERNGTVANAKLAPGVDPLPPDLERTLPVLGPLLAAVEPFPVTARVGSIPLAALGASTSLGEKALSAPRTTRRESTRAQSHKMSQDVPEGHGSRSLLVQFIATKTKFVHMRLCFSLSSINRDLARYDQIILILKKKSIDHG